MTQTTIKTTKDGREVTYQDGSVYLAGKLHYYGGASVLLTTKERKAVPAYYTRRVGSIVLTDAEAEILRRAHAAYETECARIASLPVNVERRRIDALRAQAECIKDADPGRYFTLLHRADAAEQAWRAEYPDAATEERRERLRAQAEHERSLAVGALTYDADGWLSPEDQQRAHDEHIAKAEAIEAEAASL